MMCTPREVSSDRLPSFAARADTTLAATAAPAQKANHFDRIAGAIA